MMMIPAAARPKIVTSAASSTGSAWLYQNSRLTNHDQAKDLFARDIGYRYGEAQRRWKIR